MLVMIAATLVFVAVILVKMTEGFVQYFASGVASHDDHRTERNILQDHRHAFISALLRQKFGLIANRIKRICWRDCHEHFLSQFKTYRKSFGGGNCGGFFVASRVACRVLRERARGLAYGLFSTLLNLDLLDEHSLLVPNKILANGRLMDPALVRTGGVLVSVESNV